MLDRVRRGRDPEAGAAVVDFVLISVLLLALLLVVLQVAVYFYARNVTAASAADAARYAAAAGVQPEAGTARAKVLLRQGLDDNDASAVHCSTHAGHDRQSGLVTVTVRCTGHLRLFFSPFRSPFPLTAVHGPPGAHPVIRQRFERIRANNDRGSAIVEFVFVAVVIMVPLMYLIVAIAAIQRNQLAVSEAARDAGRAFATSDNPGQARERVAAAVRLALADQHLPDDAVIRYEPVGRGCDEHSRYVPRLVAGGRFGVCVIRHFHAPGVPSILSGHGIEASSLYVVHVDDFRYFGTSGR